MLRSQSLFNSCSVAVEAHAQLSIICYWPKDLGRVLGMVNVDEAAMRSLLQSLC